MRFKSWKELNLQWSGRRDSKPRSRVATMPFSSLNLTAELELESAWSTWDEGGSASVAAYMGHLNHLLGPSHYLLNSNGVDVVSGKSQMAFLPHAPASLSRGFVDGRFVVTHRSTDGRYWLVSVDPRQPDRWEFSPYYFLVIGVTVFLCWLAAVFVVKPIRNVTAVVVRFGHCDLSARTKLRISRDRRDHAPWSRSGHRLGPEISQMESDHRDVQRSRRTTVASSHRGRKRYLSSARNTQ